MKDDRKIRYLILPVLLFLLVLFSLPAEETSLAVLPFDNTSRNSEYDWLSLGIPETLSMSLSDVHNLQLVERIHLDALLEEYKLILSGVVEETDNLDMGDLEGAELLLLGGFQIQGDRVLITIRILDAHTGTLKEDQGLAVEGNIESIFSLYDALSRQIVKNLNVTLTPAEQRRLEDPLALSESIAAYEYYIRGLFEFRKGSETGFMKAYEFFLEAVGEDPEFGLVHAYIALTLEEISYLRATSGREHRSYSDLIPDYYTKAIEFGRESAHIYKTLARLLYLRGDIIQGLRQIEKSIYINPMDAETWLIWWYLKDGDDPDHPYLQKALEIDSERLDVQLALGQALLRQYRTAESLYHLTRAYDLEPGNIQVLFALAELYEYRGLYPEALVNYKSIVDQNPRETAAVIELTRLYYQFGLLEDCIAESVRFLALEPGTMPVRFYLFLSYFASSQFDKAEEELNRIMSLDPKSGFFYDPIRELRRLEDEPGFEEPAKEMRLRLYDIKEELGRKERERRK